MSLMTSAVDFTALRQKYGGFGAPTVRLSVDGVDLVEKLGARIADVAVDLTCGFSASGARFRVLDEYEFENTAFRRDGPERLLQIGARVELELGYIVTEQVFCGLITELTYVFDGRETPSIEVECLDAKCLLMKQRRLELWSGRSVSELVSELLSEQPFSSYVTGSSVTRIQGREETLPLALEDDYRFLVELARYYGFEFFIAQGEVLFRRPPASAAPAVTLSPDKGIVEARISRRGAGLYQKVKVVGRNPQEDKAVSATASAQGGFSRGSAASRMLAGSTKVYFDQRVESAEEADSRAAALMQAVQQDFGRAECRCIGLPELTPGRWIELEGLFPGGGVACYLLDVRHTFDDEGFLTTFEARFTP